MFDRTLRGGMRRSVLAAALTMIAMVIAVAPPATAGTITCELNTTTHVVTVTAAGSDAEVDILRHPGSTFINVNGALCQGGPFVAATVTNTKRIVVNVSGTSAEVTLNLALGAFAPGFGNESGTSDEIEWVVDADSDDTFRIVGKSSADRMRLGTTNGMTKVNLNAQETTGIDADITVKGAGTVQVYGSAGNDILSANGGRGTGGALVSPIWLIGGTGDDALTGGVGNDHLLTSSTDSDPDDHDIMKGMGGADVIDALDGDDLDETTGGPETDTCSSDAGDDVVGC